MAKEGLSQELPEEGGAARETSWHGCPTVKYYDADEKGYRWWYATTNPTREDFLILTR